MIKGSFFWLLKTLFLLLDKDDSKGMHRFRSSFDFSDFIEFEIESTHAYLLQTLYYCCDRHIVQFLDNVECFQKDRFRSAHRP